MPAPVRVPIPEHEAGRGRAFVPAGSLVRVPGHSTRRALAEVLFDDQFGVTAGIRAHRDGFGDRSGVRVAGLRIAGGGAGAGAGDPAGWEAGVVRVCGLQRGIGHAIGAGRRGRDLRRAHCGLHGAAHHLSDRLDRHVLSLQPGQERAEVGGRDGVQVTVVVADVVEHDRQPATDAFRIGDQVLQIGQRPAVLDRVRGVDGVGISRRDGLGHIAARATARRLEVLVEPAEL